MKRTLTALAIGIASVTAFASAASAQSTIKVVVFQEDSDRDSLSRNNRIQNAVLLEFNKALNAPIYQSELQKYGIGGMDVYDETSLTLDFYQQDRQRRTDQELVSLARTIDNPRLDVMIPYTLYARKVTDPNTGIAKLHASMSYRALNVRDGRFLGGDNIDLNSAGLPFVNCATNSGGVSADAHCVKEFVSENAEKLARVAGNKLAIQLAALLGGSSLAQAPVQNAGLDKGVDAAPIVASGACMNIPAEYRLTFTGYEQKQVTAIENNMAFWDCGMDSSMTDSDFGQVTFSYKTRADEQRLIRNIRLMNELMGVLAETRLQGSNEITVEAMGIANN